MKKFSSLLTLLFTALALISAQPVQAADLEYLCNSADGCQLFPADTPLFDEAGLIPGSLTEKSFGVANDDLEESCQLVLSVDGPAKDLLAPELFMHLSEADTSWLGSSAAGKPSAGFSLADFYATELIALGELAPGEYRSFDWQLFFNPEVGNEYQGLQTSFDGFLNFSCLDSEKPLGPTGGTGGASASGASASGASASDAKPPVCTLQAPTEAVSLSVVNTGPNSVQLSWNNVEPSTHYALEFYRISDGAPYGSANIGKVTTYSVTNLSGGGDSYRFFIRPVNDCAPGELSNEVQITPTGGQTEGRPQGLGETGEQVLGVSTDEDIVAADPGEVLGAQSCENLRILWIVFALQLIANLGGLALTRPERVGVKYLLSAGLAVLATLAFWLTKNCSCAELSSFQGFLCSWYGLVAVIIALLAHGLSVLVPSKSQ